MITILFQLFLSLIALKPVMHFITWYLVYLRWRLCVQRKVLWFRRSMERWMWLQLYLWKWTDWLLQMCWPVSCIGDWFCPLKLTGSINLYHLVEYFGHIILMSCLSVVIYVTACACQWTQQGHLRPIEVVFLILFLYTIFWTQSVD